jgi:leucyl aminopeptidase
MQMTEFSVEVIGAAPASVSTPLLLCFRYEDEPASDKVDDTVPSIERALARLIAQGDFRGRKDEWSVLYPDDAAGGVKRLVVIGLGPRSAFTHEVLRRAVGHGARQAERLGAVSMALLLDGVTDDCVAALESAAAAATEAAVMAAWDWRELKTRPDTDEPKRRLTSVQLIASSAAREAPIQAGAHRGAVFGRAANLARSLAIRPGNVATPAFLARTARELADRFDLKLTVLDRQDMKREGMHALLAVAQGTEEEPCFIVLEYRRGQPGSRPLVIVGKGVTFDSGGISIKPAERMEDMKFDMSGAAAALGAMQGIAELEIPADVIMIVPATENLPSGKAVKPGDVIGSLLGRSIEVVNTDAEGRLILADALAWGHRYQPAAMIDAATLTGAVGIALGHHAIGLMANDDALAAEIREAGERTGERCWQLPLWDEYRTQIDSPVADIRNTGGRPGGSITAGMFLREFVGDIPWVHLDVAATAYREEPAPYLRKGPTGVPTRLFIEWVRARAHA